MTWLPQFACPACAAPLSVEDATLRPCRCGFRPEAREGVYRLITRPLEQAAEPFARQYRMVRDREGYGALSDAERRKLPEVDPGRPGWREWRVRRESYEHLRRAVLTAAPRRALKIVDLGAGNGWLSHRLAGAGHDVVAIDRSLHEHDGLGALSRYGVPITAVVADIERPPLQPAQFDAAVFNASLHYTANPEAALASAARLLVPHGALVVMDSPMFRRAAAGRRMVAEQNVRIAATHGLEQVLRPGPGFITFEQLDGFARQTGRRSRFLPSRGPFRWRAGRAWARMRLGRAPAAFGVWVAQ